MLNHGELNLPGDIWRPFAESRNAVSCSPGHMIYLQGTDATCFYYLKSGQVKSYFQSANGEERVLNLYHAGSLFGEASFFDELPRVSSAVALTPCQLVPIDRSLVTQEMSRNPALALAMMKYLARTVRLLSEQLDALAFRPAQWRIAKWLLNQARADSMVLGSQEDIAAAISVSRVTVSRILNGLARDGVLALGYGQVTILNHNALELLCQP